VIPFGKSSALSFRIAISGVILCKWKWFGLRWLRGLPLDRRYAGELAEPTHRSHVSKVRPFAMLRRGLRGTLILTIFRPGPPAPGQALSGRGADLLGSLRLAAPLRPIGCRVGSFGAGIYSVA